MQVRVRFSKACYLYIWHWLAFRMAILPLPSSLSYLPEWQGRVEMELNWSIFNWKCEKMHYVWFQITNRLITIIVTPENRTQAFCKARVLKQITIQHHHCHHATQCLFVSRIKYQFMVLILWRVTMTSQNKNQTFDDLSLQFLVTRAPQNERSVRLSLWINIGFNY